MNQEPIIFDAEFALQQFSGNQPLLLKMLNKFSEQYNEFEQELSGYLSSSELDSAKQQLHTIKGVSGNLGMNALHQASREFETELKDQGEQVNSRNYLQIVNQTLATVTAYLAENQPVVAPVGGMSSVGSNTKQDLLTVLKRNEFITAGKLDSLIGGCGLDQQKQQILRGAIDDLDYATAITLLE